MSVAKVAFVLVLATLCAPGPASAQFTQQGPKLVGTNALGPDVIEQGWSVALSADGNTAILGGPQDNSFAGAAWVFTRSSGVWSQQGSKLVGSGAGGQAKQGQAVALSSTPSCNTAVVGGPGDNNIGAAWVFIAPRATHDFSADCISDILLQNTGGGIAMWLLNSSAAIQSAIGVGSTTNVWTIIGQRDLNGDGKADILFRANDGSIAEWLMNGGTITSANGLGNPTTAWNVVGTGDFNADGIGDILFRGGGTAVAICYMNSSGAIGSCVGVGSLTNDWTVAGTGDFDGDGVWDILWFNNSSGGVAKWLMSPVGTIKSAVAVGSLPAGWSLAGTGDFNGDTISDILLSAGLGDGSTAVAIWFMNASGAISSAAGVGTMAAGWTIAQTGDFNGDGRSDLLWYNSTSGGIATWLMSSATITSQVSIGSLPPSAWMIVSANSE
jgi:hypothetical protein